MYSNIIDHEEKCDLDFLDHCQGGSFDINNPEEQNMIFNVRSQGLST